jgi:hypothetical protein
MHIRTIPFIAFAGFASMALPPCLAESPALHRVSKIHVATMGSGDQADRFHSLLQDELSKVGFEVSEQSANADAILTGTFSFESGGDRTSARATVTLKSRDGRQILWSGDYVSQHRGQGHEDVVRTVAENCAQQLRKNWEKSGP